MSTYTEKNQFTVETQSPVEKPCRYATQIERRQKIKNTVDGNEDAIKQAIRVIRNTDINDLVCQIIEDSDIKRLGKTRTNFTPEVTERLMAEFEKNPIWDVDLRMSIADELGIKEYTVYKWNWYRR